MPFAIITNDAVQTTACFEIMQVYMHMRPVNHSHIQAK